MPESGGFADRILDAVEAIPPGKVMSYKDVAEYAGIRSPRSVGQVLAADGGSVPWHRVVKSDGRFASHLVDEQRQRLISEGVSVQDARVDLSKFRWDGR